MKRDLRESTSLGSNVVHDAEAGIVRGVKIIGLESKHGYSYSRSCLRNAIPLYEGARVNIDHPPRDRPGMARSYGDRFGRLRKVRLEDDGLYGNFHYNPKHARASQFAWDVDNCPENCGFSHNARADLRRRGDQLICESIEEVRAVDLVADAATTAGLFESEGERPMLAPVRKRKKADESKDDVALRRALALVEGVDEDRLAEILEEEDVAMPSGGGSSGAGEEDVDAIMALIRKVVADPNVTADETIKIVSARLRSLKDMIPGGLAKKKKKGDEDEEEVTEGLGDEVSEASDDVLTRSENLLKRLTVLEACKAKSFNASKKQVRLLTLIEDEEELLESIDEMAATQKKRPTQKPRSKDQLLEGGASEWSGSKEYGRSLLVG